MPDTAYSEALEELAAAERDAGRWKTTKTIQRVVAARARVAEVYQRHDQAPTGPVGRVGIGNRMAP